MPTTVFDALHYTITEFLQWPNEEGPHCGWRNWGLEICQYAQSHEVRNWRSLDLSLHLSLKTKKITTLQFYRFPALP